METFCDNTFFNQDYHGLNVLVIVPHQDDEINIAGALIPTISKTDADITLVYTTNGDWKYLAETRMKEAVNAAGVLGIKPEKIIFLGYGDAINNNEQDHLFYSEDPITASSGHRETYGGKAYPDYVFQKTGHHHEYTNTNYLNDIIEVIREHRPDLILSTDFDEHPDHRMLSIYLDKAIGILRKEDSTYAPEIWKRFAYSTGYTAEADYSAINNPATKRPQVGVTEKYAWDLIDNSIYIWENRIRIPVPDEEREPRIKKNLLATALNQHRSQYIITRANRIINSDEVYWSRRTDSITYSAKVTVSSGEGRFLNDFLIYETDDVDAIIPDLSGHAWRPEDTDKDKRAIFSWKTPHHIEQIVLYGEITGNKGIEKLRIKLSDGYERVIRDLPGNGNPVEIDTGKHDGITACIVEIIQSNGAGLTEIEVYSRKEKQSLIKPYVKIMIDGNFAYEYIVDRDVSDLKPQLYIYGMQKAEIVVTEGKSKLVNEKLIIDSEDKEILLQAISEDGRILDRTIILRKSKKEIAKLAAIDRSNTTYLNGMKRRQKVHNMVYILKHDGINAIVKRTFKNVVKPILMRK